MLSTLYAISSTICGICTIVAHVYSEFIWFEVALVSFVASVLFLFADWCTWKEE